MPHAPKFPANTRDDDSDAPPISDADLLDYAQGRCADSDAGRIAAALARDAALRDRLLDARELGRTVKAHYAPKPVPDASDRDDIMAALIAQAAQAARGESGFVAPSVVSAVGGESDEIAESALASVSVESASVDSVSATAPAIEGSVARDTVNATQAATHIATADLSIEAREAVERIRGAERNIGRRARPRARGRRLPVRAAVAVIGVLAVGTLSILAGMYIVGGPSRVATRSAAARQPAQAAPWRQLPPIDTHLETVAYRAPAPDAAEPAADVDIVPADRGTLQADAAEPIAQGTGPFASVAAVAVDLAALESAFAAALTSPVTRDLVATPDTQPALFNATPSATRVTGDVTGDGVVDGRDVEALTWALLRERSEALGAVADIDGNGETNLGDLMRLRHQLAVAP